MKQKFLSKALLLLLCIGAILGTVWLPAAAEDATEERVLVGGIPFGVRFFTDGILVVGFSDVKTESGSKNPAKEAGIQPGDCILKIEDSEIKTTGELMEKVNERGDGELSLLLRRNGEEQVVRCTPAVCAEDGKHRVGLLVRDSGAGIGTVTFALPDGSFGGLGHGICDGESGLPIPMSRGSVMDVTIGGITKGAVGAPGELRGHFSAGKTGTLLTNTECGVYGVFAQLPPSLGEELPVGHREEVHNGPATVRCTLDDNCPREYTVEISSIHREETGNKCFSVKVTDGALLERSGGIVQGMSGSPVIQDGKLIGAITHVLIGDPTVGYGIFLDNMLASRPAE